MKTAGRGVSLRQAVRGEQREYNRAEFANPALELCKTISDAYCFLLDQRCVLIQVIQKKILLA